MSIDNNYMENKLRQLESQSLPDLSHQDKHWHEMKSMLAPPAIPAISKPSGSSSARKWFIAACVTAGLVLLVFSLAEKQTPEKKPVIAEKTTTQTHTLTENTQTNSNDTSARPVKTTITGTVPKDNTHLSNKDIVYAIPGNNKKCNCSSDWLSDSIRLNLVADSIDLPEDKGAILAAFFAQMEKSEQEFVIDSKRDTVIYGKDGTALLIPANSFTGNGKVTISMKEYYSYEDIITNKLSTMSDGAQLETGGMLYIKASVNGREVALRSSKSIRWFLPDTSADMSGMQLFTGIQAQQTLIDKKTTEDLNDGTEVVVSGSNGFINWRPTSNGFLNDFIGVRVRAVDLRDLPFKTVANKKYKAYYYINSESSYSKEELRDSLQKKYPYYDKIIIAGKRKKKEWMPGLLMSTNRESYEITYSIGDTAWLYPFEAKAYKLNIIDTLAYSNKSSTSALSPSVNSQLKKIAMKYSVNINTLGWVNCDRFYGDNRPKTEFVVNLNDDASDYYTFLVFERIKSMMSGSVAGNKVVFSNIPKDEPARLISVGVKNGKTVSAMQPVKISAAILTGLQFEETTPETFKEKAGELDK